MKAVIKLDVPEYQVGEDVSIYFKDAMCTKSKCERYKVGHWQKIIDGPIYYYACSECNGSAPKDSFGNDYLSPFCPECGSEMEA